MEKTELEQFIRDLLPKKEFLPEEMGQYVQLLLDVRKTVHYCLEQIKNRYPASHHDPKLVLLIGEIIIRTRKLKMLCMQFPPCFQEKILEYTKVFLEHFTQIFANSNIDQMDMGAIAKAQAKPFDETSSFAVAQEALSYQSERALFWQEAPYIIRFMTNDAENENFMNLADSFMIASWWVVAKLGLKFTNLSADPVIKEAIASVLTRIGGMCGNIDFLEQEAAKELATKE